MAHVTNGRKFKVENQQRKFGAAPKYVFVYLEDSEGDNERPYLFTPNQLKVAAERAQKNPEDLLDKSLLSDWFD